MRDQPDEENEGEVADCLATSPSFSSSPAPSYRDIAVIKILYALIGL
jgi:hypothetical protein